MPVLRQTRDYCLVVEGLSAPGTLVFKTLCQHCQQVICERSVTDPIARASCRATCGPLTPSTGRLHRGPSRYSRESGPSRRPPPAGR